MMVAITVELVVIDEPGGLGLGDMIVLVVVVVVDGFEILGNVVGTLLTYERRKTSEVGFELSPRSCTWLYRPQRGGAAFRVHPCALTSRATCTARYRYCGSIWLPPRGGPSIRSSLPNSK